MDPYLGPVAGALVAAFAAGIVLGVVRLHRLSLEWWRRRGAAGGAPTAAPDEAEHDAEHDAARDLASAPPVFGALALTALVALLGVAVAASDQWTAARAGAGTVVVPAAPATWTALAAQASRLVAVAGLSFVLTLGAALVVSLIERALARLLARFVPAGRPLADDAGLDVPALVAAGRAASPGEPFGVGLASIVLIATTVFAMATLLVALGGGPSPVAAVAVALLIVPVAYAAAAERSHRPGAARLRRDAAVRQLAVAPLWGAGLVLAPSPPALLVLALAAALALPGAPARPGTWALPWGGDAAEPSPVLRGLSRVAHGAWIVILAALPVVVIAAPMTTLAEAALAAARVAVALVAFLAARALLRRFVLPAAEAA